MARKVAWLPALPVVLLGIHSMPTITTPFYAVIGTQILIPKSVIDSMIDTDSTQKRIT